MNNKFFYNSLCVFLIMSALVTSCTYNSEEDLYPEEPMEDPISYTSDVLPILETNCYGCHDAVAMNAGINLEGYDNTVIRVEDGSLLGSIQHDAEWVAMPLAASKLSETQINKVAKWIEEGYPNN